MTLQFVRSSLAALGLACFAHVGHAQQAPLKIGLMLPFSGTFASISAAAENGFRLYIQEKGGKLGGRDVEIIRVDDESDAAKATNNVNKLIKRDNVDVLVGTVHSGVTMAMAPAAKESGTILVVPISGSNAVTGPMCAQIIFRTSPSNWQSGSAMGDAAGALGKKKIITITWKYAAGDEFVEGFKEGFEKSGGQVVKQLTLPFPNVEFQALLTEIAAAKPDAVFAFFAGAGGVKFIKDYAAAGLNKTIPLYGPGVLTEGVLDAAGDAAQGILTTMDYADNLNTPRDNAFRKAYTDAYKIKPDVYAVHAYDAAQIIDIGLTAVKGDIGKKAEFAAAIRAATVDSPRGSFALSKAHNPMQDFYLRTVEGNQNKLVRVAVKKHADPARGCTL